MRVYKGNYKLIHNNKPSIIAIGNFDGLHLGHQALIKKLFTEGQDLNKAVLTFNPHTMSFFTKGEFKTISTNQDKINELNKLKVDDVYLIDFDLEFSSLSIAEMISFLKQLNVKKVVVGEDFRFGQKGVGRPSGLENDFEVLIVEDMLDGENRISSTLVKELIETGDLDNTRRLLNHPYQITTTVMKGNQVGGKQLGFPTANLDYQNLVLPPNGVYFTIATYHNKKYASMTNIGNNPTINYSKSKKLEVHILDFDEVIYGQDLTLEFVSWLREERKFDSKEELINQLQKDRLHTKKLSKNM